MDKLKLVVLLTVFVDVLGIGIVIPVLPYYLAEFNPSPVLVTSLIAAFALCSFLSAPLMGALSDRFGRKPVLIASISSTALGWLVFALAPTIPILFLGRIIDGLAAGNLPVAQSMLVDIAKNEKERTSNLGLIGAMFGIAFIIGPLLGGLLGAISHTIPFWFVFALAGINAVSAYFFLPETKTSAAKLSTSLWTLVNPLRPLANAFRDKKLRSNYIAWFLFGLSIAASQSVFALYLRDAFGWGEVITGLLFASVGLIIAFNQGFALRRFWLHRFKEPSLELTMILVLAAGSILQGLASIPLFLIGLIAATFGQSILRVVMTSQIVAQGSPQRRGEVLGITTSIVSLSMAIAPLAVGPFYAKHIGMPFFLGALLLLVAWYVLYRVRTTLQATGPLPNEPVISEV